jgi:hypothetical protein
LPPKIVRFIDDVAESAPKTLALDYWALDRWLEKFHWLQKLSRRQNRKDFGTKPQLRPPLRPPQRPVSTAPADVEPPLTGQNAANGPDTDDGATSRRLAENKGQAPDVLVQPPALSRAQSTNTQPGSSQEASKAAPISKTKTPAKDSGVEVDERHNQPPLPDNAIGNASWITVPIFACQECNTETTV